MTGTKLRYYNFLHTQQRSRQRYNLILNISNYEQICSEIKQKKFIQLRSTFKKHQDVYKVTFKNTNFFNHTENFSNGSGFPGLHNGMAKLTCDKYTKKECR